MLRKQKQSGHHITFFYTVVIVSSSATSVHSKHHPMNIIFTILLVSTMGWTLSCTAFNSSRNTHTSIYSCWKSSAYNNGVFKGIHHSKNHIDPLGNIGKACISSHFTYPKSSHLLSCHRVLNLLTVQCNLHKDVSSVSSLTSS